MIPFGKKGLANRNYSAFIGVRGVKKAIKKTQDELPSALGNLSFSTKVIEPKLLNIMKLKAI